MFVIKPEFDKCLRNRSASRSALTGSSNIVPSSRVMASSCSMQRDSSGERYVYNGEVVSKSTYDLNCNLFKIRVF